MRAPAHKGGTARPWRAFALCALRRIAAKAAPTVLADTNKNGIRHIEAQ
jgi:hypothetical protein